MNKYVLLVVASVLSVGAQAETVEFLNPPGLMAKGLPFSPAVRVGGQVYVTGQIGTTPGTTTPLSGAGGFRRRMVGPKPRRADSPCPSTSANR